MTWTFVLLLGGCAYGLKFLGAVLVGDRRVPPALQRCLLLIPAALLAGLIAKDTFTIGRDLGIDARSAGLAMAALTTWRKAPFAVVIVAGVGTTAVIRLFV